ncbi:hypothetical protein AJ78_04482 [Emergomyces pasteurianus Ep9510]|uniref:Aminoglycoside phosphotransferase domain-containing protein n=1 Tax=Emergomyces pasteurianus Ep9510 TaxID=1447872 RepID=A0A1J9QH66_9EURO|nr:hypothetical protein AJ78_04482 [Emergomyces pasteurianus Ep9510]
MAADSVKAKQFLLSNRSIVQLIHSSDSSKIFLVKHEGTEYCLKFHVNKDLGFTSKGRDLCRHRCEIEAYKLLSTAGICEQGFVSKIYALFDDIDPLTPTLTPHLNAFLNDVRRPCAILLEYLPNAQSLNCENYTKHRI